MQAMSHRKFVLTETGLQEIKQEYDKLITEERAKVIRRIQRAREFGDLAENSEYDAAKEAQTLLETRIAELEEVLRSPEIVRQTQKADFVVIGSTVTVEIDGETDEFTIVGTIEADPAKRKISNESPVGSALLGARVGEEIEVTTTIIRARYKILAVR